MGDTLRYTRCNGDIIGKFCDFCARENVYHIDSSRGCFVVCRRDECRDQARR